MTALVRGKVCVEVGVQAGAFSRRILEAMPERLYLIDIWRHQDAAFNGGVPYRDVANVADVRQAHLYLRVCRRFIADPRVVILRMFSGDAAAALRQRSVDLVYLDANHAEGAVYSDIVAWIEVLRDGGLMCGHDYQDRVTPRTTFGVKSAVDRFLRDTGRVLEFLTLDHPPSWGFRK